MAYKDKEQQREAQRRYYQANKELYNKRAKERQARVRKKIREIKETSPCTDCGVNYPFYVMQFDHLEEFEKVGNIGKLIVHRGVNVVMEEIEKCEVVCANCHADRTWKRLQNKK